MGYRRRLRISRALLALLAFAALALPASAAAIEVEIVNESGRPDSAVWITAASPLKLPGEYEVSKLANDVPQTLKSISGHTFEANKLTSGRIFVAYGKEGAVESTSPSISPIRFDWAELTTGGVANLTAVDQFAIGMRLETLDAGGETLETIGAANSDTVFDSLQGIPGGAASTMRGADGEILRVLSPTLAPANYPRLAEYVHSLAGQTLTLHTIFAHEISKTEFERAASLYNVSIAADGTATLKGSYAEEGTNKLAEPPPAEFTIPAEELLERIYTGMVTANNLEAALRRDLYVGFANGFWGGRYGDDSANFCTNPLSNALGPWCEKFNQPGFGDARGVLSPFPTCEQYAAVINQFSDSYGNPFSDGAKNTVVNIGAGAAKKLRLTILPDSGSAGPVHSGNPNCGAGEVGRSTVTVSVPPADASGSKSGGAGIAVNAKLLAKTKLAHGKLPLGRVTCSAACGQVRAVVKKGKKKILARALVKRGGGTVNLVAKRTKAGRALLAAGQKKLRLELWVTPAGQQPTHLSRSLTVEK